jgi:hypothetical protein
MSNTVSFINVTHRKQEKKQENWVTNQD